MFYTVGTMAKRLGVAPSALRYYDKEGLFPFLERSASGTRMFHEKDMSWLEVIECMKKTGMPIKEIKQFIDWCIEGDSTIDKRLTLIAEQRASVKRQIAEMQEHLQMLEFKTWYYEMAKQAKSCSIHDTMPREQIPAQFHKYLK